MTIILQKKRILISEFEDDRALSKFMKYITVSKLDMYFNERESWAAGYETIHEGKPYMCVPRRFNADFLNSVISEDQQFIKDNSNDIAAIPVAIGNTSEPRNDLQKNILDFLIGQNKYASLAKKPRRALFANTGDGKTFLTLKYAALNSFMTMVHCPDEKTIMTWKQEIAKFTDIQPDEIAVVAGIDSFKKILKNKEKYRIILCSSKTLTSCFLKKDYDTVINFLTEMGVGLLVHDEVHLNLMAVFFLEMIASTKRTLYLTATPNRRIFKEQKILESLMPSDNCIFISEKKERFLYIEGRYYTNGDKADYKGISKPNGTDYNLYSKNIIFSDNKDKKAKFGNFYLNEVILKAMKFSLKNRSSKDNKVAILCKSKVECNIIFDFLSSKLGEKYSIGLFNSDIKDIDERYKETEKDIIVSTDKSFAGIINIPRLEIIINLYPFSSIAHVQQIMGRIREEESKKSIFIQLVDGSVSRIRKAGGYCRKAANEICKTVEVKEFNSQSSAVHEEEI